MMIKYIRKSLGRLSTEKHKSINKPIVDFNQRGQYRSPLALKVGDKINQFEVTHRYAFPDFQINSAVLKCQKYGTEWVHFDCQQQKNSIGFAIKCKQAPHIIKMGIQKMLHCGSKKYPVRNPIQFMTRRSFNPQNFGYVTSDYIFNGYQTTLLHDHKNLMQVFLNMLYNPLLRQQDFKEIMWRYELRGNKLEIVGEVANQIKDMSNFSQNKVFSVIEKELFGRESFGKPQQIVRVKYQDIVNWYNKLFSPSNLLVISHGDIHIAKIIDNFRNITKQFRWNQVKKSTRQTFREQKVQNKHIQQSKTVRVEHLEQNIPLVLSFKIQNITSSQRILLSLLSYMLFDMPNAVFMNWNTQATPYTKNYGFQGSYFNIGITLLQKQKQFTEKQLIQQQKNIRQALNNLYTKKIPNTLIQQCLYHLQNQYFTTDGIKIITNCIDNLIELGPSCLEESFNVKSFISKTLRNYRKDNVFQQLLKKFILDNKKYVRIWGKNNPELIQDNQFEESIKLKLIMQNMKQEQLQLLRNYKPSDILQNYKILPKIDINQLQIFQEKNPETFKINEIPIYHTHKPDGVKLTLKYDVTDLEEQQIKLIPVLCQSFPYMGAKGIQFEAFNNYMSMYIKNLSMNFQSSRTNQGMKLFLFLTIQFSDRNAEYGFNLLTNLVNDHNDQNLQVLSQRIQKKGSQIYNQLTQNLVQIHGRHLSATKTPYAMIEDPIFMARSTCGLASDILKIANPKQILYQLSQQMKNITKKFKQKNRLTVLFQCRKKNIQKYQKYLEIMLNPLKNFNQKLQIINDKDFSPYPCLKYFPNYAQQFVFQSFSVPYYQNLQQVPTTLVLSAIINQNIKRFNQTGGCFLFKGSLVSFMRGNRKKILQLQDYYKRIQDINEAKRFIFQQFKRYTSADLFYTGVSAQQARIFKQAVAMVDEKSILTCLQKYILQSIKQSKSSILAIGPHLGSYEPLIKKGWTIERSIQDMSLKMQSESTSTPQISMSKYINIY